MKLIIAYLFVCFFAGLIFWNKKRIWRRLLLGMCAFLCFGYLYLNFM